MTKNSDPPLIVAVCFERDVTPRRMHLPNGLPALIVLVLIPPFVSLCFVFGQCVGILSQKSSEYDGMIRRDDMRRVVVLTAAAEAGTFWSWACANVSKTGTFDLGVVTFFLALIMSLYELKTANDRRGKWSRCLLFMSYILVCLNYVAGIVLYRETGLRAYATVGALSWLVFGLTYIFVDGTTSTTVVSDETYLLGHRSHSNERSR